MLCSCFSNVIFRSLAYDDLVLYGVFWDEPFAVKGIALGRYRGPKNVLEIGRIWVWEMSK